MNGGGGGGDESKMELYIRVTALLSKTLRQGEGEKVCAWEAGMKEEGGLSEGVRRERMERKERGKRCRGGKTKRG